MPVGKRALAPPRVRCPPRLSAEVGTSQRREKAETGDTPRDRAGPIASVHSTYGLASGDHTYRRAKQPVQARRRARFVVARAFAVRAMRTPPLKGESPPKAWQTQRASRTLAAPVRCLPAPPIPSPCASICCTCNGRSSSRRRAPAFCAGNVRRTKPPWCGPSWRGSASRRRASRAISSCASMRPFRSPARTASRYARPSSRPTQKSVPA
jgi:hypothetical protein